jgi:hypothetical protein
VTAKRPCANRVVRFMLFMGAFPWLIEQTTQCAARRFTTNALSD